MLCSVWQQEEECVGLHQSGECVTPVTPYDHASTTQSTGLRLCSSLCYCDVSEGVLGPEGHGLSEERAGGGTEAQH